METERMLLFLSKRPELVHSFPDWVVPPEVIDELKKTDGVAIAEIAGRDSVAAVLVAIEQYPIKAVLPSIAYTGTEIGDWEIAIEKCHSLAERLERHSIKVFDPIFLGAPKFWWLLCGRHISSLFHHFGFYTPCLGCHLYFHALRIPLAKLIGVPFIIAGERESHNGRIKLNQVDIALDAYVAFMRKFEIDLLLPLRHIYSGEEIERIVGQGWGEEKEQLECVLSRNYQDTDGAVAYDERALGRFFKDFAFPVAEKVVQDYLDGRRPDYENLRIGSFLQAKLAQSAP